MAENADDELTDQEKRIAENWAGKLASGCPNVKTLRHAVKAAEGIKNANAEIIANRKKQIQDAKDAELSPSHSPAKRF